MRALSLFLALLTVLSYQQPCQANNKTLLLATTTSVDNTGLLSFLAPKFLHDTGITLKWTATGSGKALALGKSCDVSALLVHAPQAEKLFISDHYGVLRKTFMHNAFVIVGPKNDPAHIKGKKALAALRAIYNHRAGFISRGDNSGTFFREMALWHQLKLSPPQKSAWYLQSGQGMMATLLIAAEKRAYTLSDRGTYLKFAANNNGRPPLLVFVTGGISLINRYSIIAVNPNHCPNVQYKKAKRFRQWLLSAATKRLIDDYRLFGQPLFITYDR